MIRPKQKPLTSLQAILPSLVAALLCAPAHAYEADVHFGLTQWLALKAGFDEPQAQAIAIGNLRVDSGLMDTLEVNLEVACVGRQDKGAMQLQQRHFPSVAKAPALPQQRAVEPGSTVARQPAADVLKRALGKEGVMLAQFGAALHPLQDSWSHAGVPGTASPGGGISCAATHDSSHPVARGGAHSHDADLTHRYPEDVMPMAKATYEALIAYPRIQGRERKAAAWGDLAAPIERFARARTKTEKREWFVSQRIEDTSFLEGVTLPDGPSPGPLHFNGRNLPPLKGGNSTQHDAPADVRSFFDGLIARWLGSEPVDLVVAESAGGGNAQQKGAKAKPDAHLVQLTARMKLWKLKDHGSAATLAHATRPLSAEELAAVNRLSKATSAYVAPETPADAFYPLLDKNKYASPLLPYIVHELPASASGAQRMIAVARLRHVPYDTVGWIAERSGDRWVLTDIVAAVDH